MALPDEVGHDLADPLGVVADPERRGREVELERDSLAPRRRAGLLDGGLDGRAEVVGPQVEAQEARLELRELEEVLGQPVEPVELLAARLEELGAGVGIVAGPALEQLDVHPEGRERRPQLVGDVGEEVAAAVAVAADDVDVSSSRSAMTLNWRASSAISAYEDSTSATGTRPLRSPCAETARRLAEAPQRAS